MDIKPNEWKSKAISNITQYLNRGGNGQGDVPQHLGETELLNTIGMAMGLPLYDPQKWSNEEREKFNKGNLVLFKNKSREAIDVVAEQIWYCCGRGEIYITVLPIDLYHGGKLYELPLFRVKREKTSQTYFVDNIGRSYNSVSDWYYYNKLPSGEMAYPRDLRLTLLYKIGKARVDFDVTPCSGLAAKTATGLDVVSSIAGIGSSIGLLFVTGGLAAPIVGTAIVAAGYGTTRASYQIIDKASHGESVNPFTDSGSRMLWLGIAANITSFGAMGASMRITSLAARGRDISEALKLTVNCINGTNVAVSGFALLNTTIFMFEHEKDISASDMLLYAASVAFWTKGLYSFRSANGMIKDTQNYVFKEIGRELTPEQASELSTVRRQVQNDKLLIQQYQAVLSRNISVKEFSQFLIDGMRYYDTVSTLSPEQLQAFYSIRNFVKDDIKLISGLNRISNYNQWSTSETLEQVINMWQLSTQTNAPTGTTALLIDGNLHLGRAPPIKINSLPDLSPPMIKFFGEHLSQIDVVASRQWALSVPALMSLQNDGMFTACSVTKVSNSGRSVIMLNHQLEISIYKLNDIYYEDRQELFRLVGRLPASVSSSRLPTELNKLCVVRYRLRFQCQRLESVKLADKYVANYSSLRSIVRANLKSYEQDRLYTFVNEVELYKGDIYMADMMKFVSEMQPKNVSELVAYCEFVMSCVEGERLFLTSQIKNKTLIPPKNTKLSAWTRQKASENIFKDATTLKRKFDNTLQIVRKNNMVGVTTITKGLEESQLVSALRRSNIRFGSEASAVYHIVKHPTAPLDAFVRRANETVRCERAAWRVDLGQDGDVRTVQFETDYGKCFLLERDGSVFLCSYMPKKIQ